MRVLICKFVDKLISVSRRLDPFYRDGFDALLQKPLTSFVQFFIQLFSEKQVLAVAEEKQLKNEDYYVEQITAQMNNFLKRHYENKNVVAERAGNTKTYGLVKAEFTVLPELSDELSVGLFAQAASYPVYIRFAGPGPLATRDIDNNGILSIGIKLMNVSGDKLSNEEDNTQDFLGISCPTFTTPDVVANLQLQQEIDRDTPAWYFLNPFNSHFLDAVMQGLYARTHANPLELEYYSCVPFLFGEGRAVKFKIKPRINHKSKVGELTDNYLREAMVNSLSEQAMEYDFCIQFQTDPQRMPIENASVMWSEKLSPFIRVAKITIPQQKFDYPDQLSFARFLSFNPWHCLSAHRPLGNQNRGRKIIYETTSKMRQSINKDSHIEPTGNEVFGMTDEPKKVVSA